MTNLSGLFAALTFGVILCVPSTVVAGQSDRPMDNAALAEQGAANENVPQTLGVVQDGQHKFEVKIDEDANVIEVVTLRSKGTPPRNMSITLFRDPNSSQTIDLKSVNLNEPLPRFQGELSLSNASYVGVELRFETSLKMFKALKFVPRIPNLRNGGR